MPINQWLSSVGARRTVLAFAASFLCALAVFVLPSIVWNSVNTARAAQPQPAAAGSATGAHIHIGKPSLRTAAQ